MIIRERDIWSTSTKKFQIFSSTSLRVGEIRYPYMKSVDGWLH